MYAKPWCLCFTRGFEIYVWPFIYLWRCIVVVVSTLDFGDVGGGLRLGLSFHVVSVDNKLVSLHPGV